LPGLDFSLAEGPTAPPRKLHQKMHKKRKRVFAGDDDQKNRGEKKPVRDLITGGAINLLRGVRGKKKKGGKKGERTGITTTTEIAVLTFKGGPGAEGRAPFHRSAPGKLSWKW